MIFAMLRNTATDRWHPLLFRPAPLPGDPEFSIPRYKSKGHHTEGFDTEQEGKTYIAAMCEKHGFEDRSSIIFDWNGEGIPAAVSHFPSAPKAA